MIQLNEIGCSPTRSPLAPLQWKSLNQNLDVKSTICNVYTSSPLESQALKRERAQQFGLTPIKDPFLFNQSFPCARKNPENGHAVFDMGEAHKFTIEKLKGNALDSVSFNFASPIAPSQTQGWNRKRHLSESWLFYRYIGVGSRNTLHIAAQNPNKAIFTINSRTTEILVCNKVASKLLGIKEKNTPKKRLCDYILSQTDQYSFTDVDLEPSGELVLISGKVMDLINCEKEIVPVSVWARKLETEGEQRCLVVMEPVERITGNVEFDHKGKIVRCDDCFASLYGYNESKQLENMDLKDLIPSFELTPENNYGDCVPKEGLQQCATGRTNNGSHFPLSIKVKQWSPEITVFKDSSSTAKNSSLFVGKVWVFNNISGMITLFPDGTIHSCNTNFSLMLFGYSQNQLEGKNITTLIPTFYDDVEFWDTDSMALPPLDDEDDDSNARCCCASDGRTTADSFGTDPPRPINPMGKQIELVLDNPCEGSPICNQVKEKCETPKKEFSESSYGHSSKQLSFSESQDTLHSGTNSITESDFNANELPENEECRPRSKDDHSYSSSFFSDSSDSEESLSSLADDVKDDNADCLLQIPLKDTCETNSERHNSSRLSHCLSECGSGCRVHAVEMSIPRNNERTNCDESFHSIPEGGYCGIGRHHDGTDLAIEYHVRKVELEDGKCLYCLWVSRDLEELKGKSQVNITLETNYTSRHSATTTDSMSQGSESSSSLEPDSVYVSGTFSEHYAVLQQIGKGAFGCVKKAYRIKDGLLVIAKFICKSDVYQDLWVHDEHGNMNHKVPLEVSLLTTVQHPNVVQVIDVFENEKYFQLVMEKHGSGMDLFEFIERVPNMDEPLASYIFRQVVSAVSYLHNLFILHRDIKDENIILDEKFHVKLIDFGSATFMGEELFSTFCGTMEYCSPEVIQGNKYRGPELEMWALGVTLYTLIFGENPFVDVDETLKAELNMPCSISEHLSNLIHHLLDPDPILRCTLPEAEQHPWITQPVHIEKYNFSDVISASEEELNPPKYVTDKFGGLTLLAEDDDVALKNLNCSDSQVAYLGESLGCISFCEPPISTESEADSTT